jgi:hypothetical protein
VENAILAYKQITLFVRAVAEALFKKCSLFNYFLFVVSFSSIFCYIIAVSKNPGFYGILR